MMHTMIIAGVAGLAGVALALFLFVSFFEDSRGEG